MNYELAKQLKDAGFPQKSKMAWWEDIGMSIGDLPVDEKGFWIGKKMNPYIDEYESFKVESYPVACIPTLSELIEACGENGATFTSLKLEEGKWHASGYHNEKDIYAITGASTPEEAVAKLWLELNKKVEDEELNPWQDRPEYDKDGNPSE